MKKTSLYMKKRMHVKSALIDPMANTRSISRITPFTTDEIRTLALPSRLAFDLIKSGKAEEDDFHNLDVAINVTTVLASVIHAETKTAALLARDAMLRCWTRFQRFNKLQFDKEALLELPVALDMHEQLLELCTPLQITNAAQEVMNRLNRNEVAK